MYKIIGDLYNLSRYLSNIIIEAVMNISIFKYINGKA
jgi:hypothetical protein